MNSYFGMSTVCPPGYRPNKRYRAKRGQRQCLKGAPRKTLRELRAIAAANDVSIYKRRKDDMGFTRTPLNVRALKYRLTKMNVAHFGMSTVCPPGYRPNKRYRAKRGQRQCLKDKIKKAKYTMAQIAAEPNPIVQQAMAKGLKVRTKAKKITLKKLQKLAKANGVSIYKRRKDDMGFTRTPLSIKALKLRLTKMNVPYK
jgi:hypothetical protein